MVEILRSESVVGESLRTVLPHVAVPHVEVGSPQGVLPAFQGPLITEEIFSRRSYAVPRTDFDSRKFSEARAGKCEATPVFSQSQVKMYKVGCCFSFLEIRLEEEKIAVGRGSFREKEEATPEKRENTSFQSTFALFERVD